jgi:hypothetical protein
MDGNHYAPNLTEQLDGAVWRFCASASHFNTMKKWPLQVALRRLRSVV